MSLFSNIPKQLYVKILGKKEKENKVNEDLLMNEWVNEMIKIIHAR